MSSIKTFRYFTNVGGLNLRFNDLLIADNEAEEIINLHATANGSWTSRGVGYSQLNTSAVESGAAVHSLYSFTPLTGGPYLMAVAGTKLFTFTPTNGNFTQQATGLTAGKSMNFTTFKGLLIGCNGADLPKKWDGTNPVANLGGWPPTIAGITPGNPSIVETFANRVVFSGDPQNPSMIYISELEAPEVYTPALGASSAGAIQVSPGDGQKITALARLYLPVDNEEVLLIFKERSTYMLTGQDATEFAVQQVSDEFGAVSARSVVLVGNDLVFLSAEGVTRLSTATAQGNLSVGLLSDKIQPQINTLSASGLINSFAVHLRDRQEVWWAVPEGSSQQNQRVLVFNYGLSSDLNGRWSRRSGLILASGTVFNQQLYTGSYTGFIQQQLSGNSYNGQAISWMYRTSFYDFGQPRLRKRIKDIELYVKQISQLNITVKSAWNLERGSSKRFSRTLNITPDSASALYNSAIYGQDYYNAAGSSIIKFIPPGSGHSFQLEFSSSGGTQPVELQGWTISTLYGGFR